jgi:hypothetical protein
VLGIIVLDIELDTEMVTSRVASERPTSVEFTKSSFKNYVIPSLGKPLASDRFWLAVPERILEAIGPVTVSDGKTHDSKLRVTMDFGTTGAVGLKYSANLFLPSTSNHR